MAQASNVTKYNAGGSGDNIIADGYIKAVEKVWLDSYTIAFTGTNSAIHIAQVPANKKITSIVCQIQTSISQSSGTVSIGYSSSDSDDLAATGVSQFLAPVTLVTASTNTTIALPGGLLPGSTTTSTSIALTTVLAGFQGVTAGTNTTIAVKLNNWTMTTGTVKTIVRYT